MYSLMRKLPLRDLLFKQFPALGSSLLVAELFYKFGSFSLEAVAFLGTWFVLDVALQAVTSLVDDADDAVPAGK